MATMGVEVGNIAPLATYANERGKPYKGAGRYCLLTRIAGLDTWQLEGGANSIDAAKKLRGKYLYPAQRIIVENVEGGKIIA
jgi:hypothetical protein